MACGAFNGGRVKGVRINAVDKGKGEEVGDDNKGDERAGRRERAGVLASRMLDSGGKDRVRASSGCHHEGQDCGRHHVHGQIEHASQHAYESVADSVSPSEPTTCLGTLATDSSHGGSSIRLSKKPSGTEASKPAASIPKKPRQSIPSI